MWTATFQQPAASLQRYGECVRPSAAALTRHPSDGKVAPSAHADSLSPRLRRCRISSSRQDLLDRESRRGNFFCVVRTIDQHHSVTGALRREAIDNQLSGPVLISNPDCQRCCRRRLCNDASFWRLILGCCLSAFSSGARQSYVRQKIASFGSRWSSRRLVLGIGAVGRGAYVPGQLPSLRVGEAVLRRTSPFDLVRMRTPGLVEFIKSTDRTALKSRPEEFRHALNGRVARHPVSWHAELARDIRLGIAGAQPICDERRDLRRAQIIALDILDHLRVSIRQTDVLDESRQFAPSPALRSAVPARTHD